MRTFDLEDRLINFLVYCIGSDQAKVGLKECEELIAIIAKSIKTSKIKSN